MMCAYNACEGCVTMKRAAAILITVVMIIGMSACTASRELVGKWESEVHLIGGTKSVSYTFDRDGTGVLNMVSEQLDFTYKVDGNKLTVCFWQESEEFTFEINGDELTLSNSQSSTVYTKIK